MPVEDAGRSEGFTVMVEIGVRNLPQRESVLTSYQVCLNDNDEVNPNGGSVYNEW